MTHSVANIKLQHNILSFLDLNVDIATMDSDGKAWALFNLLKGTSKVNRQLKLRLCSAEIGLVLVADDAQNAIR